MHTIFDAVARGGLTVYEAIREIANSAMQDENGGLLFEFLAEAWRNPSVAERLATLTGFYKDSVMRLAQLARLDLKGRAPD